MATNGSQMAFQLQFDLSFSFLQQVSDLSGER